MDINFELYRIFYVVAMTGNITKASKQLHISQPAVTKQLKNLEMQLGGELFVRTKRGVVLTENGQQIFSYIQQAMVCFSNAQIQFSNLKRLESGTIRIGVSTALCRLYLMPYLKKFHDRYPNVAIKVYTDPSKVMLDMLKNGRIDILISKNLEIDDKDLSVLDLGVLHQCFIAPSTYTELKDKVVDLQKLDDYPLLFPKSPSTSRKSLHKFCKDNNINLTSKMEIASATLLEDFVKIGLGIGLVTREYALSMIDSDEVFEVITKPSLPSINFSLFTMNDSMLSFATNEFINMILEDKKKQY